MPSWPQDRDVPRGSRALLVFCEAGGDGVMIPIVKATLLPVPPPPCASQGWRGCAVLALLPTGSSASPGCASSDPKAWEMLSSELLRDPPSEPSSVSH